MRLTEWNTSLRGQLYPPASLEDAINYARSDHVENLYRRAERFIVQKVEDHYFLRLPKWSATWPGGQLSGIGRNSCFASNIYRYERVFGNSLSDARNKALEHVSIFPMEFLRDEKMLKGFLARILDRVAKRRSNMSAFMDAVHMAKSSTIQWNRIHRNAGTSLPHNELGDQQLRSNFAEDKDSLNVMLRLNGVPITYE